MIPSVPVKRRPTLARDEHQLCSTGLLWRLLRHREAGVGAKSIRAPGGRPERKRAGHTARRSLVGQRWRYAILRYTRAGGCSVAPGSLEHVLVVGSGGRAG